MSITHLVVCGFNGTTYSRHQTLSAARKEQARIKRSLEKEPHHTGNLPSYVQVVPAGAYFGRIHSDKNGDNPRSGSQSKWSEVV